MTNMIIEIKADYGNAKEVYTLIDNKYFIVILVAIYGNTETYQDMHTVSKDEAFRIFETRKDSIINFVA